MYCNRNISINWWPFCLIFMLQTYIVCVFRWLIFSPSNHNSNLCHHLNNIVQNRATTCSPRFVVVYRGWPYVDSSSALKYHIIGNFCLHSSMGAKWGLWCIRVWLYFTCCLYKRKLLGICGVGFDIMGQLLIIYLGYVRYLEKQREYNEAVHRIEASPWFS